MLVSAEGGTVFLDEIGELSLDLQAKLLRALQEKEVRPVGATHRVPIKARIVAATNRDLAVMVEKGTFRKDLFYRLNVVNLRLPALRDRREDIPLLAAHFLDHISREHGSKFTLSDEALRTMMRHDWPGNVRELENSIERACALSSGPILHLGDLPTQLQQQGLEARRSAAVAGEPDAEGGAAAVDHAGRYGAPGDSGSHSRPERRQAAGRQAAGHRQDHPLPQAEGIRHRRPASGRVSQLRLKPGPVAPIGQLRETHGSRRES